LTFGKAGSIFDIFWFLEATMPDYADLKCNEVVFQNAKYQKSLERDDIEISSCNFENYILTPVHLGGHSRGLLFKHAIQELLSSELNGKRVLDYCCGRGELGVYLAQKGAKVSGFDISDKAIEIARNNAQINNIEIDFQVMDAEDLRYLDNSFDFVIGFEALHHVLIFPKVPSELSRILKVGGKAIFAENWGGSNPLYQFWRDKTTLRKNRSAGRGEIILDQSLLDKYLDPYFANVRVEPISLFYLGKKYIRNRKFQEFLLHIDQMLLERMPSLGKFCGEAVIILEQG
jgi:ubiquinone/menaquinone biosynthesis C-methylase UbiE